MKLANIHRATRKRLAAIVMIAAAAVGFVSQSESKDEYLVTKERLTRSTSIPLVVTVSPLAQHTIDLWGVDEEMGYQWANLEVRYTIRDDSGKLLGEDRFSASESNAKGGFKRAANGDTVHLSPSPSSLHIEVELIRGSLPGSAHLDRTRTRYLCANRIHRRGALYEVKSTPPGLGPNTGSVQLAANFALPQLASGAPSLWRHRTQSRRPT